MSNVGIAVEEGKGCCATRGGLSAKALMSYCTFFGSVSAFYAIFQPVRAYVFRDTLQLRISTIAFMVTAIKAIDIATGAILGRISDNAKTQWGRRKLV